MTAYWLIVCHLIGDYVLQSDWMATEKTTKSLPAAAHVITYTLPFLFLTQDWRALALITGTHFVIDRWRLARYVCWAKNFLGPRKTEAEAAVSSPYPDVVIEVKQWWHPWAECSGTGYHKDRPTWLAVWLLIITDNTLHLACNAVGLSVFG